MKIDPHSRFVLIGDSITDAGREKPVGEAYPWNAAGLGNGYVNQVAALLTAVYPERNIRVTNVGLSGNTTRDLKDRWKTDVIDLAPDWLSIFIGINDVWRHFDAPLAEEKQVHLDEYEKNLESLVSRTLKEVKSLKGLVLIAPYYIEGNRQDPMRKMMESYAAAVKRISSKYQTHFVDTQAAFDRVLAHLYSATLGWDRIHPLPSGHMVIARALLECLDFDFKHAAQ